MIIQIDICNSIDTNILQILGKYDRIDKLFEDADKGVIDIQALDCAVRLITNSIGLDSTGKTIPTENNGLKN